VAARGVRVCGPVNDMAVHHVALHPVGYLVALCFGNTAAIVDTVQLTVRGTLAPSGHTATLTAASFVGVECDVLVTAAEDRTFVVWDLASLTPLYRSGYETPGVFLALAVGSGNRLFFGDSLGILRVFDLTLRETGGAGCRHVANVSLATATKAKNKGEPSGGGGDDDDDDDDDDDQAEGGLHILAIAFSGHDESAVSSSSSSSLAAILRPGTMPWLACATPAAVFIVHGRLFTPLQRIDVVASANLQLPYVIM
jgi:hypothetical protein